MLSIHEVKLSETDRFSKQFNTCSDLFQQAMRDDIPESDARKYWAMYVDEKLRLETGQY